MLIWFVKISTLVCYCFLYRSKSTNPPVFRYLMVPEESTLRKLSFLFAFAISKTTIIAVVLCHVPDKSRTKKYKKKPIKQTNFHPCSHQPSLPPSLSLTHFVCFILFFLGNFRILKRITDKRFWYFSVYFVLRQQKTYQTFSGNVQFNCYLGWEWNFWVFWVVQKNTEKKNFI